MGKVGVGKVGVGKVGVGTLAPRVLKRMHGDNTLLALLALLALLGGCKHVVHAVGSLELHTGMLCPACASAHW